MIRFVICCTIMLSSLIPEGLMAQVDDELWHRLQTEEMDETEAERYYDQIQGVTGRVLVNRAGFSQLLELPGMTEEMAEAIIAFRDTVGEFVSIYELLSIPGITRDYLLGIRSFLSFEAHGGSMMHQGNIRWATRGDISTADDNIKTNQVGSPHKLVVRYRGDYRSWSWGLKGEKDAGEPFGGDHRPWGFDFYSAWMAFRGEGTIREVLLGDYRIAFGHGLLCNQLFAAGGNASVLYKPNEYRIVRPHTSMDEYHYFRGGAVTLKEGSFRVTLFGSWKPVSGTILEIDTISGRVQKISAIRKSGIHATQGELSNRHAFSEFSGGGSAGFYLRQFQVLVNWIQIRYSADVLPSSTFANVHKFRGRRTGGGSLYMGWYSHLFGFTAELSVSDGLPSLSQVVTVKGGEKTTIWLSTRYLAPNYYAPYANTLNAGSVATAEQGINMVLAFSPTFGKTISGIVDIGNILTTTQAPASGRRFTTFTFEASEQGQNQQLMFRFSYDRRDEVAFSAPADLTKEPSPIVERYSVRTTFSFHPNEKLRFYLRGDFRLRHHNEWQEGWMLVTGATGKVWRGRLNLSCRHGIFQTESYDLRIFSHEQDAPGAFNMLMHYGAGHRTYLMVNGRLNRNLRFWCKGGITHTQKPLAGNQMRKSWDLSFQINYML
jgi:hypothetical protein